MGHNYKVLGEHRVILNPTPLMMTTETAVFGTTGTFEIRIHGLVPEAQTPGSRLRV